MAEFMDVIKIKNRIHEKYYNNGDCNNCPLDYERNGYGTGCLILEEEHPEEFERICLEWAKENPEITNAYKLYQIVKEAFGEETTNILKNLYTTRTEGKCDHIECPTNCDCAKCEYKNFWDKPYIDPKEDE